MSARLARVLISTGAAALALGLVAPSAALAEDAKKDSSQASEHRQDGDKRPSGKDGKSDKDAKGSKDAKGDPAGNNGTIKINTFGGPTTHANRPHPGCDFRLSLFNFDDDQTGTITFVGHAPTAGAVTKQPLAGTRLLSDDAAGGGQDVDKTFDVRGSELGLTGTPHAKQGFHIKVLVDADNAPGGAKQKVFWLSCPTTTVASPTSAVTTNTVTGTTTKTTEVTGATTGAATGAAESVEATAGRVSSQSRASETSTFAGTTAGAAVAARDTAAPQDRGSALPFTGIPLPALIALALATLAAGGLAIRAGRRRTATDLL